MTHASRHKSWRFERFSCLTKTCIPPRALSRNDMDARFPKRFAGPCSITETRSSEFLRLDAPNGYRRLNGCSIYFRTTTLLKKYAV